MIAEEYANKLGQIIEQVLQRKDLNALEKLNLGIENAQKFKQIEQDRRNKMKVVLLNDENIKLQNKMITKLKERILPFYIKIITEGVEEKIFPECDEVEMSQFLIHMMLGLNQTLEDLELDMIEGTLEKQEFEKKIVIKLSFYEETLSRLLLATNLKVSLKEPYLKRFL